MTKSTRDPFVPPGGFAGAAQQTPAAQYSMSTGIPHGNSRARGAKKRAQAFVRKVGGTPKPGSRKRKRKNGNRLKKGSAAAKAYMAKIRRKRKK